MGTATTARRRPMARAGALALAPIFVLATAGPAAAQVGILGTGSTLAEPLFRPLVQPLSRPLTRSAQHLAGAPLVGGVLALFLVLLLLSWVPARRRPVPTASGERDA
jgi:hypothetical protein